MWHLSILMKRARSTLVHSRVHLFVLLSVMLLISALLVSCGSSTTSLSVHPTPTTVPTRVPTPMLTPTRVPTSMPTPTLAPTQPPAQGPVILDLQPASMSFVGHLDCPISHGAYVCHARVLSRASNPGSLNWTSFVNFATNVTFSPGSGTLTPGTSIDVFIHIPTNDCTRGLFFFQGPANTHTIAWAC